MFVNILIWSLRKQADTENNTFSNFQAVQVNNKIANIYSVCWADFTFDAV